MVRVLSHNDLLRLASSQLWQVTMVILIVGLLVHAFCGRRPHLAYALWLLVILKCLVPPVWKSPTGVFSWAGAMLSIQPSPTPAPSDVPASAPLPVQTPVPMPTLDTQPTIPPKAPSIASRPATPGPRPTLRIALAAVWLCGVLVVGGALIGRRIICSMRLWRCRLPTDDAIARFVSELSRRLGVRRKVRVLITSRPFGPAVYGILRPTLVLPQVLLSERSADQIETIVAHELIHVRRGDGAVGLLQLVAQAVWWFHPLVWWANRQTCRQRELCCDEEVVACLACDPDRYAQNLLDVLKLRRQAHPLFAFSGIRKEQVTSQRLERIMDSQRVFHRRTPRACWLVLAVGVALLLPGAGLTLEAGPSPQASSQPPDPAQPEPAEEPNVTQSPSPSKNGPQVGQAVSRAAAHLRQGQRLDGSWPESALYKGGMTALCTLALLNAGVDAEDECIRRALGYLEELKPERTYVVALQTMVFCKAEPDDHRPLIDRNVRWLEQTQIVEGRARGAWSYPGGRVGDNSNTRFAILALYEAERIGVNVGDQTWRRAKAYWEATQNGDGSWGYVPGAPATGSMTCAGIAALAIADRRLARAGKTAANKPIARAIAWLGEHFSVEQNPGRPEAWSYYYLQSLERAGRLAGRQRIGDHDWYAEGAEWLLAQQDVSGCWRGGGPFEDNPHVATSFALLFLTGAEESASKRPANSQ